MKRRSPSKGDLAVDLDPAALGRAYADGGAACLSVLTDREFFGGSPDDLAAAREASGRPVLRKDFTVDVRDVLDARLMGADALLLIVAALDDAELRPLPRPGRRDRPRRAGRGARRARAGAGARPRGPASSASTSATSSPSRSTPTGRCAWRRSSRPASSGWPNPASADAADAATLAAAGYDALLVGETLVRASGPAAAVAALRVPRVVPRRPVPAAPVAPAHRPPTTPTSR